MNFALTVSLDKGIFTNGLQQNIIFLCELLQDLGHHPTLILNHPVDKCMDPPKDVPLIHHKDIDLSQGFDYFLQCGWVPSRSLIDDLKRTSPKVRNVHIHYGNRLLADIEQCKWDTVPVGNYKVDEVWVSPHYDFSVPYFKTYYNTQKVFILPYIWSSRLIESHNKIWEKGGDTARYSPGSEKNIAIVEPNLNMTKNCIPSIMVVEELFHSTPDLFNALRVYCSSVIAPKKYFRALMWDLQITQNNKIQFAGRQIISKTFAQECNVVVSHQLLNALNYTYLEALFFDIPLVHNSDIIKSAGYYYPDYDTVEGARQLRKALTEHDDNIERYRASAQQIIWQYSPDNPRVKDAYRRLLS